VLKIKMCNFGAYRIPARTLIVDSSSKRPQRRGTTDLKHNDINRSFPTGEQQFIHPVGLSLGPCGGRDSEHC
jgi:hypothetical protein